MLSTARSDDHYRTHVQMISESTSYQTHRETKRQSWRGRTLLGVRPGSNPIIDRLDLSRIQRGQGRRWHLDAHPGRIGIKGTFQGLPRRDLLQNSLVG